MSDYFRPIRGFGLWGAALLPIAAALAWCAAVGIDLRHEVIRVCYDAWGEDFVWDVIIRKLLFGSYWASLVGVILGPVTLTYVLVAMHVSPRRWAGWQWTAVSMWLVLNPWLCLELARLVAPIAQQWFGWNLAPGTKRVVYTAQVHAVVLVQLVGLWIIAMLVIQPMRGSAEGSRWRWMPLALLAAGVFIGTCQWWVNNHRAAVTPFELWVGSGVLWHATSAVLLIGGAVAARGRVRSENWRCGGCGYDLRGLATGACPECGKTEQG